MTRPQIIRGWKTLALLATLLAVLILLIPHATDHHTPTVPCHLRILPDHENIILIFILTSSRIPITKTAHVVKTFKKDF